MKILLVENSRTARAVLTKQLQAKGYNVESVSTGLEALEAISKSDYQLVIMDVFLPQLNGYEAAERIRAFENEKKTLPLIALTSSTDERDKRTCLDAGMNDYVIKSDDNAELFAALEKYRT